MNHFYRAGLLGSLGAVMLLAGCETTPRVTTQTAPSANLAQYQTYGFMEKLGTDTAGYTSITTQWLKQSVGRQLEARGMKLSPNPQLLVNLLAVRKDKVEGDPNPSVAVSYGRGGWGRHGGGWDSGVGIGIGTGRDVATVAYDTLTVDLVDKAQNSLVWSASGEYRPTPESQAKGQSTIDGLVGKLFSKYPTGAPVAPAVAAAATR